jgi:hypothetical protein
MAKKDLASVTTDLSALAEATNPKTLASQSAGNRTVLWPFLK